MRDKQYLSAAQYISGHDELYRKPVWFRRYVHIVVNYYAMSINFQMFGLRDLKPGETIEQVRGQSGSYELLGVKLEDQLFERLQRSPGSADLNYAVGEYLSRQATCGCGTPLRFTGDKAHDFPYFDTAYRKGVKDGWSLFRMGLHYHASEPPDLKRAAKLYERAVKLDPTLTAAHYNAGVAYFNNGQEQHALQHAKQALDGYSGDDLNADTHDLYGSILLDAKQPKPAEQHLKQALKLKSWHPHAFQTLLALYRQQKDPEAYRKLVLDYLGQDYSNSFMFNRYIEFLESDGMDTADHRLVADLGKRKYASAAEEGAVFYNLGRVAQARGETKEARTYWHRALRAMKKLKDPPEGAIPALEQLLRQVP